MSADAWLPRWMAFSSMATRWALSVPQPGNRAIMIMMVTMGQDVGCELLHGSIPLNSEFRIH